RWMIDSACGRVPNPQQYPTAGGRIPRDAPIALHVARHVHDSSAIHRLSRWCSRPVGLRRNLSRSKCGLVSDAVDAEFLLGVVFFGRRYWDGEHGDVAVIIRFRLGL